MERTKICCLDVSQDIVDFLSIDHDVYNGSLGKKVNVGIKLGTKNLLLNYDFPKNLHEYEVIIDDMQKTDIIIYFENDHVRKNVTGDSLSYIVSNYPETLFDPIPMGCFMLKYELQNKKDRTPIKILFQDSKTERKYQLLNVSMVKSYSEQYSNYIHIEDFSDKKLTGEKVELCEHWAAKVLFSKHIGKIRYYQTFKSPKIYNDEKHIYEDDPNFIPLLKNNNGEIISYIWATNEEINFMLPQLEEKLELIKTLFNEILYSKFSQYFPTIKAALWTNNENYFLPGHKELLIAKEENKKTFEEKDKEFENQIDENKNRYDFLHKILTETGEQLVDAIIDYLKWLGFDSICSKDKTAENGLLEEDIQIDLGNKGLLIIEVKGINGTSKDYECSQIQKIKYRRCEERGKFDVNALYIVNNERNIEPLKRTIPPFNEQQIKDAVNEKRGLLYTWELFNLYLNVENGIMTKDEARERVLTYGLVEFVPVMISLGIPYKYYQNNTVVCIELSDYELRIGDYLFYEKKGRYYKEKIIEIKQEDEKLEAARNGKFGFKLSDKVPQNKSLYIKPVS
ncbi:hypothetical protein SDC9_51797 [bioreactor metagenome]|uniref:Uncharacterized protein n=1 Tax=bioreactor metagenome TaxID=1076179 RepID=A0A644WPD1_9ZZZZ